MTDAVTVRRDGDLFQARLFWLRAARLLIPGAGVSRVGFECGPKAFDDIWIEYEAGRGPRGPTGAFIRREHVQCKWHVAPGTYGHADLVDPEFINASAHSLLARAYQAQRSFSPAEGLRFKLVTNWQIAREDPLSRAIAARSGALRPDRLGEGKTARSAMGGLRRLWCDHLDIDDAALLAFAPHFAFGAAGSLDDLRETMDLVLQAAGMTTAAGGASATLYDELVFAWMAQGRREFDRAAFRQAVADEKLLEGGPKTKVAIGVKSFEHGFDPLEGRCGEVLDLTPEFDQRFLRNEHDWAEDIYPRLRAFLGDAARNAVQLRLALDAHLTLSFAAGSVLDLKSGRDIEIEQRTFGRSIWSPRDCEPDANWPQWSREFRDLGDGESENEGLVVAIGLTHDIGGAVESYAREHLFPSSAGRILLLRPEGGANSQAVRCGRHAFDLAAQAVEIIRSANPHGGSTHLFLAGPGAFAFFLGQRHPLLEPIQLYEFDFEGIRERSYFSSLSLPVSKGIAGRTTQS